MIKCNELHVQFNDHVPDPPAAADVWQCIAATLRERGQLVGRWDLYGKKLPIDKLHEVLVKQSADYFNVEGEEYQIRGSPYSLSVFPAYDPETCIPVNPEPLDWDRWVASLAGRCEVVMGVVSNSEYHRWQNADSPESFEQAGRPHDHLPKYRFVNPPHDRVMIDTSVNPGHRTARSFADCYRSEGMSRRGMRNLPAGTAYDETVGTVMWLGNEFFSRTGADPAAVRAADWLDVTDFVPGILRVQAQEACFTSDSGSEAKLQWQLRDLLFPRKFPSPAEDYEAVL